MKTDWLPEIQRIIITLFRSMRLTCFFERYPMMSPALPEPFKSTVKGNKPVWIDLAFFSWLLESAIWPSSSSFFHSEAEMACARSPPSAAKSELVQAGAGFYHDAETPGCYLNI